MMDKVAGFDLYRMVFGQHEWTFLAEIILRTIIIYAYTLALVRWVGQRAVGQLSLIEFLLVIALGSAVGDAMFYPEVPLLHAMLVVSVVVGFNKALDYAASKSKAAERAIEGQPVELITHGVIDLARLEASGLSRAELFEHLRLQGVRQLGEIESCFYEPCGRISVFCLPSSDAALGLSIVPPWEIAPPATVTSAIDQACACTQCGARLDNVTGELPRCRICGERKWTLAFAKCTALTKNEIA
jgi:uncharacterized membrane protein YcaP (DUF421 family)